MPSHLAGRQQEMDDFVKLLKQERIMTNLILTGLRGVGKTVLLETLKPIALQHHWGWVGSDLTESASINDQNLALRLITDLSLLTSAMTVDVKDSTAGFAVNPRTLKLSLTFMTLQGIFNETPGLIADKLKHVLEYVWSMLPKDGHGLRGIIFAYDEAQILEDHAAKEQFPLSLLLDVFQSIQRKGVRFMLVLTGLPPLFPKLVEARTYSERMFHVVKLGQLSKEASKEAILVPLTKVNCPNELTFSDESVERIIEATAGHPYFIQFICKEVYDIWIQKAASGEPPPKIPILELIRKLDADFFAGRWGKATDRQRDLLNVISLLDNCDGEFTVQEIVRKSKEVLKRPFSSSHVNQMLSSLIDPGGLIYKDRYGKYLFAVPLMGQFIRRQAEQWKSFNI